MESIITEDLMMDGKKIGTFLKTKIKEMGITQEAFAEVLGISASAVSQNLSGDSMFSPENLMKISNYLNISVDSILRAGEKSETDIEKAVKAGIDAFVSLHKRGYKVTENDANGKTAMDYAIQYDKLDVARYLVLNNLYVGGIHTNPYYLAMIIRHNDEALLSMSYQVENIVSSSYQGLQESVVEFPVFFRNQYEIEHLVSKGASLFDNIQAPGKALIQALFDSSNDGVWAKSMYLRFVNQRYSPNLLGLLLIAIELDRPEVFNRITRIHLHFDMNMLFHHAIRFKSKEVSKLLIAKTSRLDYLSKMVDANDVEYLRTFFESAPDHIKLSSNLISTAVKSRNLEIVKIILNQCNQTIKNAALREVNEDDLPMVHFLLDLGAKFTYVQEGGLLQEIPGLTGIINVLRRKA